MKKKIDCFLFLPHKKAEMVTIKNDYRDIKSAICAHEFVSCITRKVGDTYYDFWIDDEGLLYPNDKNECDACGICKNAYEVIAGGILIAQNDGFGETIGLKPEDVENIMEHISTPVRDLVLEYDTSVGLIHMKFSKDGQIVEYEA